MHSVYGALMIPRRTLPLSECKSIHRGIVTQGKVPREGSPFSTDSSAVAWLKHAQLCTATGIHAQEWLEQLSPGSPQRRRCGVGCPSARQCPQAIDAVEIERLIELTQPHNVSRRFCTLTVRKHCTRIISAQATCSDSSVSWT